MKNRKTKTFIFKGLGFPIKLIDVPMKKMIGEWVADIDWTELQLVVLKYLAYKLSPLTKDELRFIRKFLCKTTSDFGNLFGVTHSAVSLWENGKRKVSPAIEFLIRLHVLDHLHLIEKEFGSFYKEVNLKMLSNPETKKAKLIKVDASEKDLKIAI